MRSKRATPCHIVRESGSSNLSLDLELGLREGDYCSASLGIISAQNVSMRASASERERTCVCVFVRIRATMILCTCLSPTVRPWRLPFMCVRRRGGGGGGVTRCVSLVNVKTKPKNKIQGQIHMDTLMQAGKADVADVGGAFLFSVIVCMSAPWYKLTICIGTAFENKRSRRLWRRIQRATRLSRLSEENSPSPPSPGQCCSHP